MKEKARSKAPQTFVDYIATLSNQLVRVVLSSGEKRDGVLVPHTDYVTFDGQYGGFSIAHIASITPLSPHKTDRSNRPVA